MACLINLRERTCLCPCTCCVESGCGERAAPALPELIAQLRNNRGIFIATGEIHALEAVKARAIIPDMAVEFDAVDSPPINACGAWAVVQRPALPTRPFRVAPCLSADGEAHVRELVARHVRAGVTRAEEGRHIREGGVDAAWVPVVLPVKGVQSALVGTTESTTTTERPERSEKVRHETCHLTRTQAGPGLHTGRSSRSSTPLVSSCAGSDPSRSARRRCPPARR